MSLATTPFQLDLIRRLEAVTTVLEKAPGTSSKDGGETLIQGCTTQIPWWANCCSCLPY